MKFRSSIVVLAVLAVMLTGAASSAFGEGFRHGGMMHQYRQLNLTDAQKTQIKSIKQAQHATMHPLMQQMMTNRIAMLQATANGAYDQRKVQSISSQQAQIMAQMSVARQSTEHQIYTQVLTAQQQTQLNQMRASQIERMTQHLQTSPSNVTGAPAE